MGKAKMTRATYLSRNVGEYPAEVELLGRKYVKVDDLRYGTNPHQTAAYYRPVGLASPIGSLKVLKTGKSGLSQTNLEDVSYALNIVKFFPDRPACTCMKHVNPCGVAVALPADTPRGVYLKARDVDPRAAFGCTAGFNCEVDADTAQEIMGTFNECVVAPAYSAAALAVFNDQEKYALNRHIRVIQCGDLRSLPKFVGDDTTGCATLKVLHDGSLVIADPLLTNVKSSADLKRATGTSKDLGEVVSTAAATDRMIGSMVFFSPIISIWFGCDCMRSRQKFLQNPSISRRIKPCTSR